LPRHRTRRIFLHDGGVLEGKLGFGLSLPQIDLLDSGDDPFLGPEAPSGMEAVELVLKQADGLPTSADGPVFTFREVLGVVGDVELVQFVNLGPKSVFVGYDVEKYGEA